MKSLFLKNHAYHKKKQILLSKLKKANKWITKMDPN